MNRGSLRHWVKADRRRTEEPERVDLEEENKRLRKQLAEAERDKEILKGRDQFDAVLPGLEWDVVPDARASRISLYPPLEDASVDNEDHWDTYRDRVLTHLGPFRDAFQPHIDQLTAYVPPVAAGDPAAG